MGNRWLDAFGISGAIGKISFSPKPIGGAPLEKPTPKPLWEGSRMTKAFMAHGTRLKFNGAEFPEVRNIEINMLGLEFEANYIANDPLNQQVIYAFQSKAIATIKVLLPNQRGTLSITGEVKGEVRLPCQQVATLACGIAGVVEYSSEVEAQSPEEQKRLLESIGLRPNVH